MICSNQVSSDILLQKVSSHWGRRWARRGQLYIKISAASKYNSIDIYLAREEHNWGSPYVPNVATEKKQIMNKDQIAK